MPERIQRTLLYEDVIGALYDMIDEGHFQAGDMLPTERELTLQLGVSRNILREAFHVLEKRGIIVSRQGKGRFLREIPDQDRNTALYDSLSRSLEKCTLQEAYEVRQTLEVKIVEMIIENASEEDIADLEAACSHLEERFRLTGNTSGEFGLHRLYAKMSKSVFMEQIMDIVLTSTLEIMNSSMIDILKLHQPEEEILSHKEIVEAIRLKDVEKAKRKMFEHIQNTIDMIA